jgi:hypothetical protein
MFLIYCWILNYELNNLQYVMDGYIDINVWWLFVEY